MVNIKQLNKQVKASKRKIKWKQNKPSIFVELNVYHHILDWPFSEREWDSGFERFAVGSEKKNCQPRVWRLNYFFSLFTFKHTSSAWCLLNWSCSVSGSYNVIYKSHRQDFYSRNCWPSHIITKKCINFARNMNYAHKNISSFEGFIASNQTPILHMLREK